MVMDLTIPMGIIVLVHHIMEDHNLHRTDKEIIHIDTKITAPGAQVVKDRSMAIGVLEGVKVLLLSMNSTK